MQQQAAAATQQQLASSNVMHDGRSCGKLLQSDCSDVEKSLLNGKRNREFGSVSSQEQERFLSHRQNLHDDYLEREARRALQGEGIAQRRLSENEVEMDRMIWGRSYADWAAVYGINSQLESQKTELHHAHQWACQTQMERINDEK